MQYWLNPPSNAKPPPAVRVPFPHLCPSCANSASAVNIVGGSFSQQNHASHTRQQPQFSSPSIDARHHVGRPGNQGRQGRQGDQGIQGSRYVSELLCLSRKPPARLFMLGPVLRLHTSSHTIVSPRVFGGFHCLFVGVLLPLTPPPSLRCAMLCPDLARSGSSPGTCSSLPPT